MIRHHEIWAAIEELGRRRGWSLSRLATEAGLDPTALNRSKRVHRDGKGRWPSTETLSKLLNATQTDLGEFASMLQPEHRIAWFSARLAPCADIPAVVHTATAALVQAHGADFGDLQLVDSTQSALELVVQRGFDEDFVQRFRWVSPDQGTACARAMRERRSILIEDVQLDEEYEPYRLLAAAAGYRAVQSTPLITNDGEFIGVFSTQFARPNCLDALSMAATQLYARSTANAIAALRSASSPARVRSQVKRKRS